MTNSYISRKFLPTPSLERFCRGILYFLVTTLVFEGIIRKLMPSVVSTAIFFLKDFICIVAIYIIFNKYCYPQMFAIKQKWTWVCLTFIPLVILTFTIDPPLAVFGAKQYLLYVVVALLTQYCFFGEDFTQLRKFLSYFSILLIPTTAVAMLQNSLPSSSWINQGIGGTSLEGFSAGGFLRVSSTFSFTGQYSWYLNATASLLITSIILSAIDSKKIKTRQILLWSILVTCYTIGIFITGGRTAVFGAMTVIGLGFFCLLLKRPLWTLTNGIILFAAGFLLIAVLKSYKPEYFTAYTERSKGSDVETNQQEIANRVTGGLTDWTTWYAKEDFSAMIMGNGLGVMSNGAEQVSSYAKNIRLSLWTEGDTATIVWEGGLYLAIIWYLFRFSIILLSFRIYWSFKDERLNFAGAFLFGYIAITGFLSTISTQPPIAIWWWLAIGVLISLKYNEHILLKQKVPSELQSRRKFEKKYIRQ